MTIQVLGSGCRSCKKLFETTKKIVNELGIHSEVEYIDDVAKMIEMGIMQSPVLAIDGKPVLAGGGHSDEEIKNALSNEGLKKGNHNCCSSCCNC